jgi:hypothetical protein
MTIIAHSRKFIFVKTMKTAGTALEMALSKYCSNGDILAPLGDPGEEDKRRELAGIVAQNYLTPLSEYPLIQRLKKLASRRREFKYGEHTPAWLIRRRLGEEVWNGYFKFTVVRNPFDRCVSRFYYTKKRFSDTGQAEFWDRRNFDQFLRYHPELINENWRMYTEKDEVVVDFVIRYEHLQVDLAEVSARIGLAHNLFEDLKDIRVKAGYRPDRSAPSEIFDERQKLLVSILCRKEMEAFGYQAGLNAQRATASAIP